AIAKAVDELVAEGSLKEKLYGKQKVFVFDQSKLPAFDEDELKSLENEVSQLSRQLEEEQQLVKSLDSELRRVSSGLTKAEALAELERIDQELQSTQSEVSKLRQRGPRITEDQLNTAIQARDRFVVEWRKRKRMAMDIIDAIAEGYPKSKKQLIIDIGIETDEDCGVQMPTN
ncbi:ous-pairing protein 2, partial [Fasciolopsis buskii]